MAEDHRPTGRQPEIDFDAIDPDDPFEIDDRNRAHLAKHPPFTEEDVYDAFFSDPIFVQAEPPAHWLMIANIPGDIVVVPVMPAASRHQMRPLGIYRGSSRHRGILREQETDD